MSKPRLPWLRLYERIIDDEKILMLAKEDRWNFITLLCLKRRGVLENTDPRLRLRMIATKMGLTVAEAEESIRRMVEVSLTDAQGNPLRWDDLQFESDTSTERSRKYRERMKKSKSNGDATLQKRRSNGNATGQDTDTDTDIPYPEEELTRYTHRGNPF